MDDYTSHEEPIADADLVLRTRSGDAKAFGELWRRHYPSGMSVARSITSSIDPDDLVQESYTRIYQAIIKGGGPNGSFRAYLFTSIRNTAAAWGRARRESTIDELETIADPDSTDEAANEALDRSLTAQAFRSLPSRWQEVLWYTEIEQMKPQQVGPLLGMKSGAVSQLAFRAREGLREAWIQAHLRSAAPGSDCQWTIEHLGAYSRGNLSTRDHKRLEGHLDECARCMIVAAEAKDVSKRLVLVLLPLVLGVSGSVGYLATLQGSGAPIVALAAMPSGVTEGAVVAGGGSAAGAASAGLGRQAGAGKSAGTGSGAGGAGGVLSGAGVLVGVGAAALVVAGVVAGVTIIPGLTNGGSAASSTSALGADPSSITADVGPDTSMSLKEPVTIETDDPSTDPTLPPTEEALEPVPEADSPTDSGQLETPATPLEPSTPVEPVEPVEPPDPVEPTDPPGPQLPEGVPTFSGAEIQYELSGSNLITHYLVPVTGAAGATVSTLIDGGAGGNGTATLVAAQDDPLFGYGTIDLRPSLQQICDNATVEFFYVAGDQVGTSVTTTLRELNDFFPRGVCAIAPGEDPVDPPIIDEPIGAVPPTDESVPVDATTTIGSAPAPVASDAPAAPAIAPAPVTPVAPVAPSAPAPVAPAPADQVALAEPVAAADSAAYTAP